MVLVHMSRIAPSDHYGAMQGGGFHGMTGAGLGHIGGNVARAMSKQIGTSAIGVITGRDRASGVLPKVIAAGGHELVRSVTGAGLAKPPSAKRRRLV